MAYNRQAQDWHAGTDETAARLPENKHRLLRSTAATFAFVSFGLLAPSAPAWALPGFCVPDSTGAIWTCSGQQDQGIVVGRSGPEAPLTAETIIINNLTSDLGPISDPTRHGAFAWHPFTNTLNAGTRKVQINTGAHKAIGPVFVSFQGASNASTAIPLEVDFTGSELTAAPNVGDGGIYVNAGGRSGGDIAGSLGTSSGAGTLTAITPQLFTGSTTASSGNAGNVTLTLNSAVKLDTTQLANPVATEFGLTMSSVATGNATDGGSLTLQGSGSLNLDMTGLNNAGVPAKGLYMVSESGPGLSSRAGEVRISDVNVSVATTADDAHAVSASSIGGSGSSGGNGGFVGLSGVFNVSTTGYDADGFVGGSFGGDGSSGGGGNSGDVNVAANSGSTITTQGDKAVGMAMQTIGGRGGSGGSARGVVAFAADGARGGGAGQIELRNFGDIETAGDQSAAMLAQSIGGSGGSGGSAFGAYYSQGGSGGSGGGGNNVTIKNNGTIKTNGHASIAIEAQSIGGTGGSGGGVGALASVGGGSGGGGNGGNIFVTNTGNIETGRNADVNTQASDDAACPLGCSYGLLAQSIGGGGGNGGGSGGWFSVGGSGANGGAGGRVQAFLGGGVNQTNSIETFLDDSQAVLAQSIGGGGGNGGNAVAAGVIASAAIGGKAKNGNTGGTVQVGLSDATVTTHGDRSTAIQAQSIGGGGGNGGFAVSGSASIGTPTVDAAVGGKGGEGGAASSVIVEYNISAGSGSNSITTSGNDSQGVLAQSVGGGGGNGGFAVSVAASGGPDSGSVAVAVGGAGGTGSTGSAVTVTKPGAISTSGDRSGGIVAQSIGGGGGNGGMAIAGAISVAGGSGLAVGVGGAAGTSGGEAGAVTVTSTDTVTTAGMDASGITAQSIGGGGGNGGSAIAATASLGGDDGAEIGVAVGRNGSVGGSANTVKVHNNADVSTAGVLSDGIIAQAVGGGGGKGGMAIAGSLNMGASNSFEVALGGGGGSGADGGDVTVNANAGTVSATGNGARGIVAQSIGGGGGNGGMAITGSFQSNSSSKDFQLSIGGAGGEGSAGKTVTVTNDGAIATGTASSAGNLATVAAQAGGHGILAQSIGGGGGSGGVSASGSLNRGNRTLDVGIGGSGGTGAFGGEVTVTNTGSVATNGAQSDGILAQSLGGGGGDGGGTIAFDASTSSKSKTLRLNIGGSGGAGAVGGSASVDVSGANASVAAQGLGSRGVVVQSVGGGGGTGGGSTYYTNPKVSETVSKAQVVVGIGGAGGSGSSGDTAQVTMSDGTVSTGSGIANPATDGAEFEGHAIVVQSIGGGGGSGGAGFGGAKSSSQDMTLTLGIGGSASKNSISDGGSALVGSSTTAITGTVTTTNYNSHGVLVQSIGGGGGTGGVGLAGDVKTKGEKSLVVGIGGQGGAGGDGTLAAVYSDAAITVEGAGSKGIVAQGIGGGGGAGNTGIAGNVTNDSEEESSKQLTFGLGGAGGGGGDGGVVHVGNTGAISTGAKALSGTASEMDAIFAQSVGGGGGQSGIGIKGDLESEGKAKNFELNLGISLAGGSGGDGKAVTVDNQGALTARGDGARGIFAQSVGGGGGNGNAGIEGDISASTNQSATADKQINVALGGQSGPGGSGGTVAVTNTNSISIDGLSDGSATANTAGILAQSVGGGGGNAGVGLDGDVTGAKNSKALSVFMGGQGAAGGDGADVGVTNSGTVTVTGDAGRGIHGQSVGGGGGNGGIGLNGKVSSGDDKTVSFALGQSGGAGGAGGEVTISNSGSITTGEAGGTADGTLSDAFGLFGQSVGGGGGMGVLTGGLVYGDTGGSTVKGVDFVVGGGSGSKTGNQGGTVIVSNDGDLTTFYAGSHAHFAQSVGGGGGHAGTIGGIGTESSTEAWAATIGVGGNGSFGDGGFTQAYMTSATATATTYGDGAHGVFAQSVGGGGGTAANAAGQGDQATGQTTQNAEVGITLGGSSGTVGTGGTVLVGGGFDQNAGKILAGVGTVSTSGSHAVGILAQSIGGGGGTAAEGLKTSVAGSTVQLGKDGANPQGNGEFVGANFKGTITTGGDAGHGIFAQSVGGGGGYAGYIEMRDFSLWGNGSNLNMGGGGLQNGSGDIVQVTLGQGGSISTAGSDAVGIFAQSVGGGGGVQGSTGTETNGFIESAAVGSAGGLGITGAVTVNVTGASVKTTGAWAHGIVAQGAAKAGVNHSQQVSVTVGAGSSVMATGIGASGIIAQNTGSNVQITVAQGGSVTGGLGSANLLPGKTAAVWVLPGSGQNTIVNRGTIAALEGPSGVAVQYTNGTDLRTENYGTITGTTRGLSGALGTGASGQSELINHDSGLIIAGGLSNVDVFTNHGRYEIGGAGVIDTLLHSAGSDLFTNKDGGVLALDLSDVTIPGTGYDQFLAFGQMGFELGSLIELTALPVFQPRIGMSFDLLVAEDLFFETEGQVGFDLFDYVAGSFLNPQLWDLSIEVADPNTLLADTGSTAATAETLRLSYVGSTPEIPLPPGALLGGSTFAVFGLLMLRRRLRDRR